MFDACDCVEDNRKYVGFIDHVPAYCEILDNRVKWLFPHCMGLPYEGRDIAFRFLNERLTRFLHELCKDGRIFVQRETQVLAWETTLTFFFKEKQDDNLFN